MDQVHANLAAVEDQASNIWREKNLFWSPVRSGSAISMPGMMDTILNLGLNSQTLLGLINGTGNDRFVMMHAAGSYNRLVDCTQCS